MVFLFLCLTYFTQYDHLQVHLLLQMALFHDFLWLSNISLCVCVCVYIYIYCLFMHSSTDDCLGCFQDLTIVSSAEMNFFYWSSVGLQYCIQFLLCSRVNQLCLYTYSLFFRFPSHLGHCPAPRRIPYTIQYVLINYLFYTQQ